MKKDKIAKTKVLVAMSGGVDSSVAAWLLVKAGYDVTGAFMVNFEGTTEVRGENCWRGDYRDALRVAANLGISLLRLNFVKEYKKSVLDYMYREYQKGRTPNPDVLCNKHIKFGYWLNKARKLGFDYIATGHYAKLLESKKKSLISKNFKLVVSKDANKDQTYFLHQLTQDQLKHVLFPIGGYLKSEIREIAKKNKLSTANKEESMGICFVGEVPMKKFLSKMIKTKQGKIMSSSGEILGKHEGLSFYTIGERIGLNFAHSKFQTHANKPIFVVAKNLFKNELIVGFDDDPMLYKTKIFVNKVNWIAGRAPKFPLKCQVRLRHRQALQSALIKKSKNNLYQVIFNKPQRAVTSGQFAVFYLRGECLGGGEIQ